MSPLPPADRPPFPQPPEPVNPGKAALDGISGATPHLTAWAQAAHLPFSVLSVLVPWVNCRVVAHLAGLVWAGLPEAVPTTRLSASAGSPGGLATEWGQRGLLPRDTPLLCPSLLFRILAP